MAAEEFDIQKKYEKKKEEERQREKGIVENKKKITQIIKLSAMAGGATAGPPIGPILGQHQLNTALFCKEFNALTAKLGSDLLIPVFVVKRADKTFDIILRGVTSQFYLRKSIGLIKIKAFPFLSGKKGILRSAFFSIVRQKNETLTVHGQLSGLPLLKIVKSLCGTARSLNLRIF